MSGKPHYHIDKVEIVVSAISQFFVKAQHEGLLDVYFPSPKERERGFKTKIICTIPSPDTLKLLSKHIHKSHKISCIELAKDIPMVDEGTADIYVRNEGKKLRKKWGAGEKYDGSDKRKQIEKGLWSDCTYYFGNKNRFGFKIYARDSKFTKLPVAHSEFVIKTSDLIRKKAGIERVNDLLTTDIETLYERLGEKYILHQEINLDKLDTWLKKIEKGLPASIFCTINGIHSPSDLINFFKEEKQRIRSKRGVRTLWEKKVQRVSYRQFLDDVDAL